MHFTKEKMKYFRQLKIISGTIVRYKQGKIFLYNFWAMIFLVVPDKMASSVVLGVGGKGQED